MELSTIQKEIAVLESATELLRKIQAEKGYEIEIELYLGVGNQKQEGQSMKACISAEHTQGHFLLPRNYLLP